MGGSKISKKPNENKSFFIIYQKTKFLKLGSPKNESVEKTQLTTKSGNLKPYHYLYQQHLLHDE